MILNKFDDKYEIRMALYSEIDEVMEFINLNWKKDHILAKNRDFFEYEHVIDGKVNFLIAKNRESKEIEGIVGFLPASKCNEKLDIWGVVWKVNEKSMPMLGMELKKRLVKCTNARTEMGVGCNPKTSIPLLKRLMKYEVGKMRHYYILSKYKEFKIAKIKNVPKVNDENNIEYQVKICKSIEDIKQIGLWDVLGENIPYKDIWYVNRRYFEHPIYKYEVYTISEREVIKALIVLRCERCNDSAVLRIVDYIGEERMFAGLKPFFQEKLLEVEYIDFYTLGFEDKYIFEAGMVEKTENDANIIPNYFHPFEQRNVDIWVASSQGGTKFFKADGDQDRPN